LIETGFHINAGSQIQAGGQDNLPGFYPEFYSNPFGNGMRNFGTENVTL